MTPEKPATPAGPEPPGRSRGTALLLLNVPRSWLLGAIVAIVVILGALTVAFAVVNNDRTCGRCHVIKPRSSRTRRPAHYRCRRQLPGVPHQARRVQLLHPQPAGRHHIIEYVSGHYERPITTYVGAENCVQLPPQEPARPGHGRRQHPRQPHGAARGRLPVHRPATPTSATRARSSPVGSRSRRTRCPICARCHNGVTATRQVLDLPRQRRAARARPRSRMHLQMQTASECAGCHKSEDASAPSATTAWPCRTRRAGLKSHGPSWSQRGKSDLRLVPHQEGPDSSASTATALAMPHPADWHRRRTRSHGGSATRALCVQVPRPEQLHQLPRPADAAPG